MSRKTLFGFIAGFLALCMGIGYYFDHFYGPKVNRQFFSAPGRYVLIEDNLNVAVFLDEDLYNYRFYHGPLDRDGMELNFSVGPSEGSIDPKTNWFIYPENEQRIWVYDGNDLVVWVNEPKHSYNLSLKKDPEKVSPMLPEEVKQRITLLLKEIQK